ncbi:MAG: Peptidyl-prolyl cis-trans isomerase D [Kerstersia gyiorum]|uniref:SurA N-terminal domain-containing protein n=1 Tax=Kerstersia gyiorum TaxID=206506 RepID=UPI0030D1CDB4
MFDFIRNHKRWMQFILLLLILPSFVFVGVQGYTTYVSQDQDVAVVDGEPVTRQMFDRMLGNALEQERQRLGSNYDPAQVDTPALRSALLDSLLQQAVVAQAASNYRFSASDEALRRHIAQQPYFQQDGRFSPERYRDVLASQGLSTNDYEASVRGRIAIDRVVEPIGARIDPQQAAQNPWNPVKPIDVSVRVPDSVVRALYAALRETRDIQVQSFKAEDFAPAIEITQADIQQWYDANGEALRLPEFVDVEYVVLDEAAARAGVEVSDDDIQSYYDQNKSLYSTPERRRASHIQISVDEKASQAERDAALARAKALAEDARKDPAAFAKLARENSQDVGSAANGGDLGWIDRASFPVTSIAEAVYAIPEAGGVSEPVPSRFGYHVVQLSTLEKAQVQPLADVRSTIAEEVRTQKAGARFAEQAGKLTSLVYDQRDSLQPVTDTLGLKIRRASGVSRNDLVDAKAAGADAAISSPDAVWLNSARVRQAVFANDVLKDGHNTGLIELEPNKLIALRVAKVHPSALPELALVSDEIRAKLRNERASEAARAAGKAALAGYQAEKPATLPHGFGEKLQASRERAMGLQPALLDAISAVHVEDAPAFVGVENGPDYEVVYVADVTPAGTPNAEDLNTLRGQLDFMLGEGEKAATLEALQQVLNAKLLPEAQRVIAGEGNDSQGNAS